MSAANERQDATPPQPQLPPPQEIGRGHPEYHFVQSVMEMQKTLGEINASIKHLTLVTESTKAKVDDLVKWKHMIVGGAVVIGSLFGLVIAMIKFLKD